MANSVECKFMMNLLKVKDIDLVIVFGRIIWMFLSIFSGIYTGFKARNILLCIFKSNFSWLKKKIPSDKQ